MTRFLSAILIAWLGPIHSALAVEQCARFFKAPPATRAPINLPGQDPASNVVKVSEPDGRQTFEITYPLASYDRSLKARSAMIALRLLLQNSDPGQSFQVANIEEIEPLSWVHPTVFRSGIPLTGGPYLTRSFDGAGFRRDVPQGPYWVNVAEALRQGSRYGPFFRSKTRELFLQRAQALVALAAQERARGFAVNLRLDYSGPDQSPRIVGTIGSRGAEVYINVNRIEMDEAFRMVIVNAI